MNCNHGHMGPDERIACETALQILDALRKAEDWEPTEMFVLFSHAIRLAIHEAIHELNGEQVVLMKLMHDKLTQSMGEEEFHREMARLKKLAVQ